jgi:hypothetical protein
LRIGKDNLRILSARAPDQGRLKDQEKDHCGPSPRFD